MYENDSMLEIAKELMEKKRKPHSVQNLAKEVFEIKGLKISENLDLYSQFLNDFMLCGYFICCGEDKKKVKLWDLKSRQKHEVLEKDIVYLEDPYDDDDDVVKNELKEEDYYNNGKDEYESQFEDEDDDEEDEEEKDDIEEELLFGNGYSLDEDDDDDEEDSFDDDDDITVKPKKK